MTDRWDWNGYERDFEGAGSQLGRGRFLIKIRDIAISQRPLEQ